MISKIFINFCNLFYLLEVFEIIKIDILCQELHDVERRRGWFGERVLFLVFVIILTGNGIREAQ